MTNTVNMPIGTNDFQASDIMFGIHRMVAMVPVTEFQQLDDAYGVWIRAEYDAKEMSNYDDPSQDVNGHDSRLRENASDAMIAYQNLLEAAYQKVMRFDD